VGRPSLRPGALRGRRHDPVELRHGNSGRVVRGEVVLERVDVLRAAVSLTGLTVQPIPAPEDPYE